jgi:hypothetical protein
MAELLGAMGDADPRVRARAGVAVQKILHADFFFRADDPPEKRRAAIARIRAHWESWRGKLDVPASGAESGPQAVGGTP